MVQKEYEKDAYFEMRDKLIRSLPEPEKSIYNYFRMTEKKNMMSHGRLVVDGVSPIEKTAEHFMMDVAEVKKICLMAINKINRMMNHY